MSNKYYWKEVETYDLYHDLLRPDGSEVTTITEPEDRIPCRDLAPITQELNLLYSKLAAAEKRCEEAAGIMWKDGHGPTEDSGYRKGCQGCAWLAAHDAARKGGE